MRSTCRLFMAAILFTAVAGFASAQDASAAPPPAPDVAKPVELAPIPFAPEAPAVEPALATDQSAPAVEPAAPATVESTVAEKPDVTTTAKRVTKKTAKKPAEKPAIEETESLKAAAAAASTAAVDMTAKMPPPDAAASTAPPQSIAPPPPSAKAAGVESGSVATKSESKTGIGSWFLGGIVVAALVGIITLIRRRKIRSRTSIVDVASLSLDLEPAPIPRP